MSRKSRHPTDADGPTGPKLRRSSGARSFDWVNTPTSRAWSGMAHERLPATIAAITSGGGPFPDEIPRTPRVERVLLDWCVCFVERLGSRGALEMALYYCDTGWIDGELHGMIRERVVFLIISVNFEDAPTEEDHVCSFSYIIRLSAMAESK